MLILLTTYTLSYKFGDILLYPFKIAILLDCLDHINNPIISIFLRVMMIFDIIPYMLCGY